MLTVRAFTFNPVEENTYVLYNENNRCCIIDPGCYFQNERDQLKTDIEKTGLEPVLLLNTHCHLDHVFGNKFVYDTWKLPLHIHEKEKPLLDYAPLFGKEWQLPFDNYEGPLVYLEAGKKLEIDEDELEILFAPGHSPGHLCFYNRAGGFVIGGDVLFQGSIGRFDLPGGDFETLINSIRTQLLTLPDETIVYPGHGSSTTIGYEKFNNPYLRDN
jgi:hydroxyacylglutathione hydrolase